MSLAQKLVFSAFLTLLLLFGAECALRVRGALERPEQKVWVKTEGGSAICYSSEPESVVTYRLEPGSADLAAMERIFEKIQGVDTLSGFREHPENSVSLLLREAPFCVLHHEEQRRRGHFPDRPRQVAILGDSFAYGEGVSEKETIAYQLSQRYPRVNFPSLAGSGADTFDVHGQLKALPELCPRCRQAIYFFNLNDVPVERERLMAIAGKLGEYDASEGVAIPAWLLQHSAAAELVRKFQHHRQRTARVVKAYLELYQAADSQPAVRRVFAELKQMAARARGQGVTLSVVLYPAMHKERDGSYPFVTIHRRVLAACREAGLPAVDGLPAFAEERRMGRLRVHTADSHPNGRANARLATYLAKGDRLNLR